MFLDLLKKYSQGTGRSVTKSVLLQNNINTTPAIKNNSTDSLESSFFSSPMGELDYTFKNASTHPTP